MSDSPDMVMAFCFAKCVSLSGRCSDVPRSSHTPGGRVSGFDRVSCTLRNDRYLSGKFPFSICCDWRGTNYGCNLQLMPVLFSHKTRAELSVEVLFPERRLLANRDDDQLIGCPSASK